MQAKEDTMGILLLVRRADDDVRSAVKAASDVYGRRHFAEDRQEAPGIWLKPELEANPPTWPACGREIGAGMPVRGLRERYPQLTGGTWFVDHRKQRIVSEPGANG